MDTTYIQERKNFLSLANKNLEDGLFDETIALAEERLSRYPGDSDACIITATCLIRMGNLTQAWEILSNLDGLIREWSQAYELLGNIYRKKEMAEEAIESYQKVLYLNPDSPMKQHISNKIDSLKYSIEEDEEAAERPVAVAGEEAESEMAKTPKEGKAEVEMEDAAEKKGEGEGETSRQYRFWWTLTMAEMYLQQGHHEMARDVLNRILANDPENIEAREKLKQIESLNDNKWTPVIDELNRWLENLRRSES